MQIFYRPNVSGKCTYIEFTLRNKPILDRTSTFIILTIKKVVSTNYKNFKNLKAKLSFYLKKILQLPIQISYGLCQPL